MKKKDLEQIASTIARAEQVLKENSVDPVAITNAKKDILRVSEKVESLEDMMIIDDMVQKILEKS